MRARVQPLLPELLGGSDDLPGSNLRGAAAMPRAPGWLRANTSIGGASSEGRGVNGMALHGDIPTGGGHLSPVLGYSRMLYAWRRNAPVG